MPTTVRPATSPYAYALLLALCACGHGGSNTAPRLSTIPLQQTASGTAVTLDVSSYVTNIEGDALTYSVDSGGGSFTGSTYTNTFATLGTYTVDFTVTDTLDKHGTGSFTVKVTSANLVAFDETENGVPSLHLLDADTHHTIRFAANGDSVTFKAALPKGQVVYERSIAGQYDLYVWDVATRTTTVLGNDQAKNERYAGKTSDGKVVFTAASGTDTDLYLWNPATGMTRTISNTLGQVDENAVVTSGNYVFYERGNAGQRDVWYYSYADDESLEVATGATAEQIVRAVGSDSILLTRVGGSGESDLLYYSISGGLVEIAGTSGSGLADYTKSVLGLDASNRVVFYATSGGTRALAVCDPTTGDLRTIASGAGSSQPAFSQVAGSFVAWREFVSGSDYNVRRYSWDSNTSATVASSSDAETAVFMAATGEVYFTREVSGSDVDLYYWNGTSASAVATAGGSAYSVLQGFADGAVVYSYDYTPGDGGALYVYTPGGSSTTVTTSNAFVMGDGAATGDFVYQTGTGTSADLAYWTGGSTLSSTTIAATASVGDLYVLAKSNGDVLFKKSDGSTSNLYYWKKSGAVTTQVTDNSATHATASAFSAAL
jgi:Tol biopolymer transport system component